MGRKGKTDVDKFQTLAWYNSIASAIGTDSAYQLEKIIRGEKVIKPDGRVVPDRGWDKYKIGDQLPRDGYKKDGSPETVPEAEIHVPESGDVYRHLIWKVMRTPYMRMEEAVEALSSFKPEIASYYYDLHEGSLNKKKISLGQNLWRPILIRDGDYYTALDCLAVNLMFLRIDIWNNDCDLREIVLNIANALPSISISPWIGPFHRELFDWLEVNVWHDLFNTHYDKADTTLTGWRKIL